MSADKSAASVVLVFGVSLLCSVLEGVALNIMSVALGGASPSQWHCKEPVLLLLTTGITSPLEELARK